MVIPGTSIACFDALSASLFSLISVCAGILHVWTVIPGYGALLVCHIFNLVLGNFLLFSMVNIELNESVYYPSYILSFIAVISAVWIETFSGSAPLLVELWIQQHNLLSFLWSLIHPCRLSCCYHVSHSVVGSAAFFHSHSRCVYHLLAEWYVIY